MKNYPLANILGVNVSCITMEEAVLSCEEMMDDKKFHILATCNAEMIMMANRDMELKYILNNGDLVVPDGAGTVWAANHLGYDMKERVAGIDLIKELFKVANNKPYKIYFLGAGPNVAQKAKEKLIKEFPNLDIVGVHDGYFDTEKEKAIIEEIKNLKPDLLLVALGVPKQEKWIMKHQGDLNCLCIGVGGSFDVLSGNVKRAPKWIQNLKLEWLYRGLKDPKRIGRLMVLPEFVLKVKKERSQ